MSNPNIEQEVIAIVAETLKIEEKEKITKDSQFVDDLGADSLDLVELMMAFADRFGCDIPDDEANKIITIADAVKYIKEKTTK